MTLTGRDMFTTIRSFINNTMQTGVGFIEEVLEDGTVIVDASFSDDHTVARMKCEYLSISSNEIEHSMKPTKNDIVLVLAMQHKDPAMFHTPETVVVEDKTGYTYMSCVCVPLGTIKNGAKISVNADDGKYSVTATKIFLNGDSKGAAREGDEVEVTIPAGSFLTKADKGVLNATPVKVQGVITSSSKNVMIGD